jgi:prefoldin alpha subunit
LEKKKLAGKAEEEFRKLTVELRLLEQTAEALQSRINMVNAVITDLTYANQTLEGLEKEEKNPELLVPIGGSSYVNAKLEDRDKVIVGMGAGVSVEKTWGEAKEIIKKRLEDLEKTRTSLQRQFAGVAGKVDEDRNKLEALATELRKRQASGNV